MKKWVYILTIVCFVSCKVETTIQPKTMLNDETIQSESSEDVNLQANAIANAMVILLQNDTIRNALYIECGKGVEEYFWISFEEFQKRLLEKWNMNFDSRLNEIIARQNELESNINYLRIFLENARTNGFSPHLSIPNLQKLTNTELTEDRILDLSVSDVTTLSSYTVSTYLNYEEEGKSTGFNGLTIKDNNIVSKFIPNDLLCDELLVMVAYRIVNPNVVSPCANGSDTKYVYNCVFNSPVCKICNDQNQINVPYLIGNIANSEHVLICKNSNLGIVNEVPCYEDYEEVEFGYLETEIRNFKRSFGFLSSISSINYYHPVPNKVSLINNQYYKNMDLKLTLKPIKFKHFVSNPPLLVDATKVTICSEQTDFFIHELISTQNEIAGGIYSLSRLNGQPMYFYFPGHLYGSILFNGGADNLVNYSLDNSNSSCHNTKQSIYAFQGNWLDCYYCSPVYNSINLDIKYFVNNDKNFLIDFWYSDKIAVAMSLEAVNYKTPEENIIFFNSSVSNANTCLNIINNKVKIAELKKSGDLINQLVFFEPFCSSGTSFFVEANVQFESGKFINSCGVINTKSNINNTIKAVSFIPFGNVKELNIQVYKIL